MADFRIPTAEEDPMHAPPWKAEPPGEYFRLWAVTTDRGDPREEYDVFEDPPEWAARLAAAAPEMYRALQVIEDWWLDGEMQRQFGAPAWMFMARAALEKLKGGG